MNHEDDYIDVHEDDINVLGDIHYPLKQEIDSVTLIFECWPPATGTKFLPTRHAFGAHSAYGPPEAFFCSRSETVRPKPLRSFDHVFVKPYRISLPLPFFTMSTYWSKYIRCCFQGNIPNMAAVVSGSLIRLGTACCRLPCCSVRVHCLCKCILCLFALFLFAHPFYFEVFMLSHFFFLFLRP